MKKSFGEGETRQEVLRGMSFSVAKGEFCVLLGPSGLGKSTLLNIIGGIDSADSAEQSSRIPTFFFAMNPRELWTIRPQRRF